MNRERDSLSVLQLVRVKGRVSSAAIASSLALEEREAQELLHAWTAAGAVTEANGTYRITAPGRERLGQVIEAERATLDAVELLARYHEFHPFNVRFKELITDWQVRDGAANTHQDPAYDNAIVDRLSSLHQSFAPLLSRMVAGAPRLAHYRLRFDRALLGLRSGDHSWVARPIKDSYHTVWFELHEDLIGLTGRTRADEAAEGRAE